MMKWNDYLSCLMLSIKLTVSVLFILVIVSSPVFSQQDSLQNISDESSDSIFVMKKSPWGAVLRSTILPGWGQFYNESYIKIPVIWGIAGWLVYGWIQNNDDYKLNRDLFIETGNEFYRQSRNFYRDQRDNFTIYLAILYLMNLVDAYVDAHLFDFTVGEDHRTGEKQFEVRFRF